MRWRRCDSGMATWRHSRGPMSAGSPAVRNCERWHASPQCGVCSESRKRQRTPLRLSHASRRTATRNAIQSAAMVAAISSTVAFCCSLTRTFRCCFYHFLFSRKVLRKRLFISCHFIAQAGFPPPLISSPSFELSLHNFDSLRPFLCLRRRILSASICS